MNRLQPVVLSGGSGTRLWPLSRSAVPKQFLRLIGKESLLQGTVARAARFAAAEVMDPVVVCNETHRWLVKDQLAEMAGVHGTIVLEPVGRNTAPALTLAALLAQRHGQDPLLLVMPADHLISDSQAFQRAVDEGIGLAAGGGVVTFGIVPESAETGFGYIRCGAAIAGAATARQLSGFVEKPDRTAAEAYLADGGYLWNSGIFLLRSGLWIELLRELQPGMLNAVEAALHGGEDDGDFVHLDPGAFNACPSDSIDYAVMERLGEGHSIRSIVVPLSAGWSDLGAWPSIAAVSPVDAQGNATFGDVIAHESHNNLIYARSRMVATVGVEDLIVVETPDAVLVTRRDRAQDVKSIPARLRAEGRSECDFHRRVHRPWGVFEGVDAGHRFQVKRITVKPGAALSLQMHHHRAEHWVVVTGTARVTCGDEAHLLTENQSIYIPLGTKHRLENPGSIPLEIIEIQTGAYLGEDDIVRFEDVYQRDKKSPC